MQYLAAGTIADLHTLVVNCSSRMAGVSTTVTNRVPRAAGRFIAGDVVPAEAVIHRTKRKRAGLLLQV